VNRHFGGKYHFHLQGRKSAQQETSVQQMAGQNKPVSRDASYIGLEGKRRGMKPIFIGSLLCLTWLPGRTNEK
jgi:hypothetical protein